MEYRGSLQLSRRRQGGVDAFDGSELRFPERLRFHFFQVGVGIAEIRPDVFFVGEEAFLFGARAHVQDVHFAAAAEYALEPATELGGIHGAATLGEVGQHGRIAVEAVGGNGDDVVLGTEVQVVGQAGGRGGAGPARAEGWGGKSSVPMVTTLSSGPRFKGWARRMAPRTLQMPEMPNSPRSEEHTSELQSLRHLVCRL